jgi:hypothetical protein
MSLVSNTRFQTDVKVTKMVGLYMILTKFFHKFTNSIFSNDTSYFHVSKILFFFKFLF